MSLPSLHKPSQYVLHVLLVDGRTHEVVKDCSVPFNNREDAAAAGNKAATLFKPFSLVVYKYEAFVELQALK